jgi:hypothetical protein
MTAVSGNVWTSAQFNAHIRDNLLETMPGKATAANRIFASSGINSIAERVPTQATVATSQTTTSATYTDLATTGPAVTVTTGTKAIVWFGAEMSHSSNAETSCSVAVSSATTVAASDNWRCMQSGTTSGNANRFLVCHLFTNLTAGSNVFTMKYRTASGTATFVNRDIIVLPL